MHTVSKAINMNSASRVTDSPDKIREFMFKKRAAVFYRGLKTQGVAARLMNY